jgi:hypothetical protein
MKLGLAMMGPERGDEVSLCALGQKVVAKAINDNMVVRITGNGEMV